MDAQGIAGFLKKDAKEAQKFFLETYWQKRPLLVRGAFPGGIPYVDPDDLAGLACHEGVESRLVFEKGKDRAWQTEHGPFSEKRFATLPPSHWTLLVQAVDRRIPEVSRLRESFSFIPNWRLDDIMISYAADQGSVGPHTDNYDVFLIQAMGQRRWQYSDQPLSVIEFQEGLDLKILKDFRPDQDFVLEAGDMLYLPPHVAHHGVAIGECLTYSVGFRAPTQNEMLLSFGQFVMQAENPDVFFSDDPAMQTERLKASPGELLRGDREGLRRLLHRAIDDDAMFHRWIGAFLTEPRHFHEPFEEPLDEAGFAEMLKGAEVLHKVEGGRFTHFAESGKVYFSVEGETMVVAPALQPLVRLLCERDVWDCSELEGFAEIPGCLEMLVHLWNEGYALSAED